MQNACPASRSDSTDHSETHQQLTQDLIVNASRFAQTNLRPALGRGMAVRGGDAIGLAMNGQISHCCRTDLHLPVSPASLWLEGNQDQMHPGEGSA